MNDSATKDSATRDTATTDTATTDTATTDRAKLALYWAASCGGCEIAVLELEEKILDVAAAFDIVFWPVALDYKVADVEALDDAAIDLCLFNGAIRNSENKAMAELLRRKSKILVAFGSCAHEGCIPALSNTTTRQKTLDWVYRDAPSNAPSNGHGEIRPQEVCHTPHGEIRLPVFWDTVRSLDQVVEVDYFVPGCPPQAHQIEAVMSTVTGLLENGGPWPPRGTVLGAGEKTCCDECPLEREERKLRRFVRPHEIIPEPGRCLLDQGLVCMGPATRSGCGALCTRAGMPCRGCYGPPPNCRDQGTKMLSALASVIDSRDPEEIDEILDSVVDPIGTFYRFSMAKATLGRPHIP